MKKIGKISALIITKDRPTFLKSCLNSLKKQTILPDEVVVIDSSSSKKSKTICESFKKVLKIIYKKEKRLGIAYGRNTALENAPGEILAFIDDDCVAKKDWIQQILFYFNKNQKTDVLLGRCKNYYPENVFAAIQQSYYDRWLMENLNNIRETNKVNSKSFCDFENIAFKKSFIKDYRCSLDLPFGGINEDIEMGYLLADKGKFVYRPEMIIYHKHKTSFKDLLKRNFLIGFADQQFLDTKKIDTRKESGNYVYSMWFKECYRHVRKFNFFKRVSFWLVLFIYPIFYKIGRLAFKLKKY